MEPKDGRICWFAHLQAATRINHVLASVLTKGVRIPYMGGLLFENTVLSPRSTTSTAPPGEQSRRASYVINYPIAIGQDSSWVM